MASSVSFEQVEALAAQLPPSQRLKLAARICDELSASPPSRPSEKEERQSLERHANSLLAELDAIAESIDGNFDSAEDIRQIRHERANRS